MTKDGKIILDDEVAEANHASITLEPIAVQIWREPITLGEFIQKTYFHEVSINTVTCSLAEKEKIQEEKKQVNEKGLSHKADPDRDAKILALLDTVPSHMGWRNVLSLPEETRISILSSKKDVNDGPSKEIKAASTSPAPVPKSRCKEGQSPFLNCADRCEVKATNSLNLRVQIENEGITLPVQQSRDPWIVKASLPHARKDGFDPVAYKLMESSGFDFSNPEPMGKVAEAKAYGLNQTQQKLQEEGERVNIKKCIAAMKVDESEGENAIPMLKNFVFDRIKPPPTSSKHSVFDRLEVRGEKETLKQVFQRLGKRENNVPSCLSRKGIFNRLGNGSKIPKSHQPKKTSVFSRIDTGSKKEWRKNKKAPQTNSNEELDKEVKSIIRS
ncbi:putative inactive glutathione hydrolase 4 [Bienertia sinuspersici]